MPQKAKPEIFFDPLLAMWETPLKKGHFRIATSTGKTTVKKFLGVDVINDSIVGPYFLSAHAAKYLADVSFADKDRPMAMGGFDGPYAPSREQIVFRGSLSLYEKIVLPGTKVEGLSEITSGPIWFSRDYLHGKHGTSSGLLRELLSGASTDEEYLARINVIKEFYTKRQAQIEKDANELRHRTFTRGQESGERSAFERGG